MPPRVYFKSINPFWVMEIEEAKQLLIKYRAGKCTDAEKTLIESSFLHYNEHEIDLSDERIEEIGEHIYAELPISQKDDKIKNLWSSIAAIAAITLLSIGSWHLFDKINLPTKQEIVADVEPGSNKAIITLANGATIKLNGGKNGVVINSKELAYLDGTAVNETNKSAGKQILSTPNGGQYHIVLSDGTKVWLNASSSLTYAVSFDGAKQRIVELSGEAYFEVAHNSKQPFYVKTANQTVEVLGTHFNINSYNDDGNTITTLLEGAVKVSSASSQKAILKPNQQSVVTSNNIKVKTADLETDMAWKNGRIEFKDADIQTIMKQVSRWYDVEVEYSGKISVRKFNGSISRASNLSVLLKILAYSDIRFTIVQGNNSTKKLIVTP